MTATDRNNRREQQYIICAQLGTDVRKRFLAEYEMLMFRDGTRVVPRSDYRNLLLFSRQNHVMLTWITKSLTRRKIAYTVNGIVPKLYSIRYNYLSMLVFKCR